MYSQTIDQLTTQRVAEVRAEATRHRSPALIRESRESIRERAGWTLIQMGLRLTEPQVSHHNAGPRPAGL
jgi:hypothetical protein